MSLKGTTNLAAIIDLIEVVQSRPNTVKKIHVTAGGRDLGNPAAPRQVLSWSLLSHNQDKR